MSEYTTIEHYVNYVIDEITKRDVDQVSERLRVLGWEEVVHCRDCAWYEAREYRRHCDRTGSFQIEPDGFCAWGERMADKPEAESD